MQKERQHDLWKLPEPAKKHAHLNKSIGKYYTIFLVLSWKLDKAHWLDILWNYIAEEAINKS